jgi:hypothetical protein
MKKKYGGFVDESILKKKKNNFPDWFAINGRSSFDILIKFIKPKKIFIPYYICKDLIDVIEFNKIKFEYYPINQKFNPKYNIILKKKEYALIINYFGIKNITKTKKNHIYDLSLSFFNSTNKINFFFNSARKFMHVPCGSFLSLKNFNKQIYSSNFSAKYSSNFSAKLSPPKNYKQFEHNEKKQNIITKLFVNTYLDKNLIYQDLKKIKNIRKRNYSFFYNHLKNINMLKLKKRAHGPLYFPLLLKNGEKIRRLLNKKKIYTPILWKNLKRDKKFSFEYNLAKNCIFLPIDQRYNIKNINYIWANLIKIIENES